MRTDLFEKPVSVLVGLGLSVEVCNATGPVISFRNATLQGHVKLLI